MGWRETACRPGEHWQIQERAQPIQVDFGGDRVEEGQELTESYRTALAYLFARQEQIQNAILRGFWSIWHNSGTTF